jgi:hypothetical protein
MSSRMLVRNLDDGGKDDCLDDVSTICRILSFDLRLTRIPFRKRHYCDVSDFGHK